MRRTAGSPAQLDQRAADEVELPVPQRRMRRKADDLPAELLAYGKRRAPWVEVAHLAGGIEARTRLDLPLRQLLHQAVAALRIRPRVQLQCKSPQHRVHLRGEVLRKNALDGRKSAAIPPVHALAL